MHEPRAIGGWGDGADAEQEQGKAVLPKGRADGSTLWLRRRIGQGFRQRFWGLPLRIESGQPGTGSAHPQAVWGTISAVGIFKCAAPGQCPANEVPCPA